eukprot:TRINITY_DN19926_c0_g1_i1.p1 TRINITY_DN19926_c0_g1~~TRINITY_DN19926_c0_g1_i1.p1  ORF type:complete len:1027 (-),score=246.70 TRINITY_DN19926_c0_g1_i1:111-3191(-)
MTSAPGDNGRLSSVVGSGLLVAGASSVPLSWSLTTYQVGLCVLLVRYAQTGPTGIRVDRDDDDSPKCDDLPSAAQRHDLFEVIRQEVQAARGPKRRSLQDLQREMCASERGRVYWKDLAEWIRGVDSPDALFETFYDLEGVVAKELVSASPLHANGIFGQFARLCILCFKHASFETIVKLYDDISDYIQETDDEILADAFPSVAGDALQAGGARRNATPQSSSSELEQLGRALMAELRLCSGRVPYALFDMALELLEKRLPQCHIVAFLRYWSSAEHRLADDAASSLREFQDGHQQRGVAALRGLRGAGGPGGGTGGDAQPWEQAFLPDMIQQATLAIAGLHADMRHVEDALHAIGESICAAQENNDASCLCACLYSLSQILLQTGLTGKAFTMMRRCLHRADALGEPILQAFCCLGIAHCLAVQPSLADRRQRGLLWRESVSKMAVHPHTPPMGRAISGPAAAPAAGGQAAGAAAAGGGAASTGGGGGMAATSRAVGVFGTRGSGSRGGLTVLAALLGATQRDDLGGSWSGSSDDRDDVEGTVCRDALAHIALASQLATQAATLSEARPKVLLCRAEVARLFGLNRLAASTCGLLLEAYKDELAAEERALALCQLAYAAEDSCTESARPLLRDVAKQLPHAGHLWSHIVGPQVVNALLRKGESAAVSSLLFQTAGTLRAAPPSAAASGLHRLQLTCNAARLYHRQLLPAYQSVKECVEKCSVSGNLGDVCGHLICLVDVWLAAQDPVSALGPAIRCLAIAQSAHLLRSRVEAMVRLAKIKLLMRDYAGALQLVESVSPQLSIVGSASLRGEAFMVQADVLFSMIAASRDLHRDGAAAEASARTQQLLLREAARTLATAAAAFEAAADLNPLRRCYYLLARAHHELGDRRERNAYSSKFRRVSEFLDGAGQGSWQGTTPAEPMQAAAAGAAAQDAAMTMAPGSDAGHDRADETIPGRPLCPALSQLLAMAQGGSSCEAAAAGANEMLGTSKARLLVEHGFKTGDSPMSPAQSSQSYYPMTAAVLGA